MPNIWAWPSQSWPVRAHKPWFAPNRTDANSAASWFHHPGGRDGPYWFEHGAAHIYSFHFPMYNECWCLSFSVDFRRVELCLDQSNCAVGHFPRAPTYFVCPHTCCILLVVLLLFSVEMTWDMWEHTRTWSEGNNNLGPKQLVITYNFYHL